jgi:hypothetical protein
MKADLPISAILRKADPELPRLFQMGETRSLPLVQGFTDPLRHIALHASGKSAAVKASPAQTIRESTGLLECLRQIYLQKLPLEGDRRR